MNNKKDTVKLLGELLSFAAWVGDVSEGKADPFETSPKKGEEESMVHKLWGGNQGGKLNE